jgi:bacteriocin-like protein
MKFNLKIKDLLPTGKETETTANVHKLELEELSDQELATINGGFQIISASTASRTITAEDYYKLGGFWGG